MTNPGDRFQDLWALAERDLAGPGATTTWVVTYTALFASSGYVPNERPDGTRFPTIIVHRQGSVPQPHDQPDLVTRPVEDACVLAHEHGHYFSHQNGERTPEYELALAVCYGMRDGGRAPTTAERDIVYAEEHRAWEYARNTLTKLGVDDWVAFRERREEALKGYRELRVSE
jgi:hypothetical protein